MAKIKIGILSGCFVMMSYLAISPAIADISSQFSSISISVVQMLVTLPILVGVQFMLLAGKLTSVLTEKSIAVFSISAILLGGCIPLFFSSSILYLIISSCIMGIGIGCMVTISSTLICQYFHGEERSSLMGIQASIINIGGITFSILGGQLANISWKYAYYSFLLVIPALIAVMILLPKGEVEKKSNKKESYKMGGNVYYLAIIGFLFSLFMNTYNTNISLYVIERQFGGSIQASIAGAFCTFGGVVAGIMLKKVLSIFRKYIISLSLLITALGLGLTFIGTNLLLVYGGGVLVGFGFAVLTASGTFLVSQYVTPVVVSMGIAIFSSVSNLGSALSPVFVNKISGVFFSEVKGKFLLAAVALMFIFVITVFKTRYEYKAANEQTNSI